jgi:hypothetical protein
MIELQKIKAVVFVLALGVLLQSCASMSGRAVHPHNCPGANPGIVPIKIDYGQNPIDVVGPNQTVYEGDVLRFNLVGNDEVLVSTSGKTPEAGWLNGSGKKKANKANSDRFYVCVPTDLFEGEPKSVQQKDYEYNVDAVGRPTLDPVVPVRRLN